MKSPHLAILAALGAACAAPPAPPDVWLVSGCAAWIDADHCVLEGPLYVYNPEGLPRAALGGQQLVVTADGPRAELRPGPGVLTLAWGERTTSLTLLAAEDAWPGAPEPAGEHCDRTLATLGPATRARTFSRSARMAPPEARGACRDKALAAWEEAGWPREAAQERNRLVMDRLAAGAAPSTLEAVLGETAAPHDAEHRYALRYTRGFLERERGVQRAATRAFRDAAELAELAIHPPSWRDAAIAEAADLASRAGDHATALALLAERLDRVTSIQDRFHAALHYAWALLRAAEDGVDPRALTEDADPIPHLKRAWSLAPQAPEALDAFRPDVAVDLALAHLHLGDAHTATTWLAAAEQHPTWPRTRHWIGEVRGRVALAEGRADDALTTWREVQVLADQAGDLAASWRARDGIARAQLALGLHAEADATWQQAHQHFLSHAAFVPLHEGREAFLARRRTAALDHAHLRLVRGDAKGAMEVLRAFRRQVLATVRVPERIEALDTAEQDELQSTLSRYGELRRQRTELVRQLRAAPADSRRRMEVQLADLGRASAELLDTGLTALVPELTGLARGPADDEALVAVVASSQGWLAVARDRKGTAVAEVRKDADPWRSLTGPLGRTGHTTLLLDAAADGADLHAVGTPSLLDEGTLSWSVDLPARPSRPIQATALIVGDPGRNLPAARTEAEAVSARLTADGFTVTTLLGRDATVDAVLAGLEASPGILHFAGHATVGDDPWDARLELARGEALRIADLLTLPAAPALVVLAGCETGASRGAALATFGLAQAFVHAGSNAVVATTRRVDDALASAMSLALYEADPVAHGPATAFRQALTTVQREQPDADWRTFRLIVP